MADLSVLNITTVFSLWVFVFQVTGRGHNHCQRKTEQEQIGLSALLCMRLREGSGVWRRRGKVILSLVRP